MASIRERQQLADTLRQIGQDNAFVYQAGVLAKQLDALPDMPAFNAGQVSLGAEPGAVTTLKGCTDLVSLPGGGGSGTSYDSWLDLIDRYFHDERLPEEPLPEMEDAFGLAGELVQRVAVAEVVSRNRNRQSTLERQIPQLELRNEQRLEAHKAEVERELPALHEAVRAATAKRNGLKLAISPLSFIESLLSNKGCLVYFLAVGAAAAYFKSWLAVAGAVVACLVIHGGIGVVVGSRESRADELDRYISETNARIAQKQATPTWYEDAVRDIEGQKETLGETRQTLAALGRYEWPLSEAECQTLDQVTHDISADAATWRRRARSIIDASVEAANRRIYENEDRIGLMPNAVGNALELASIVENGYADDVKEAMLYMATNRYRTSNLGLQAAQLNQMELARMENAEYMRGLMAQLCEMSGQLESIGRGIDGVAERLDTTNRTLEGISSTLDSIDSGVWTTASAAQATAVNTAATAANTARIASDTSRIASNTAAGAYHASRAANAAEDLRDFYAEDHPSHNANGNNERLRRSGDGQFRGYGMDR